MENRYKNFDKVSEEIKNVDQMTKIEKAKLKKKINLINKRLNNNNENKPNNDEEGENIEKEKEKEKTTKLNTFVFEYLKEQKKFYEMQRALWEKKKTEKSDEKNVF